MATLINVMLVDDHSVVLEGMQKTLQESGGFKIVAVAKTGEEALALMAKQRPDVVTMDIHIPGMGGMEAVRRLIAKYPDVKVLVVTALSHPMYPIRLLRMGAAGYMTKTFAPNELVQAIRAVHMGQRYISADVSSALAFRHTDDQPDDPFSALPKREFQVAMLIIRGIDVPEIASMLCLSTKTINSYRYRTFDRLGVKNNVAMTLLAYKHGLVDNADLQEMRNIEEERQLSESAVEKKVKGRTTKTAKGNSKTENRKAEEQ